MFGLSADNLLAAAAVWVAIMLPSAAFGSDPVAAGVERQRCQTQPAATHQDVRLLAARAV